MNSTSNRDLSDGIRRLYPVLLLAVMSFFLFADQNLLAPNLTQIADEFGFTAEEKDVKLGGSISLVFWLLGGVVTLGIGVMTDRGNRKNLLTTIIFVGEVPCLLTGFAENYTQLFWLRALTGIGIGGALPLMYSMLGDYYPASERARAAAWIGLAMGAGIAVGQLVAGFAGPQYGWRLPFIMVAVPNFFVAIVFWLTVREPNRGQTEAEIRTWTEEGHSYSAKISRHAYRQLFSNATNRLIFLQGALATIPWSVFFVFLNDFYAQEKGFSVESATLIVMSAGLAAIIGGFLGGLAGNKVYNYNPAGLPLLCGLTTILGVLPVAWLIAYPSQIGVMDPSVWPPITFGFAGGFLVAVTAPNVRAMLLNVNAPEQRGSIFSLYNLADDLGRGFGPVIISGLIVAFGREWAFQVANLFWVIAGLAMIYMTRTFPEDEERLRQFLIRSRKNSGAG